MVGYRWIHRPMQDIYYGRIVRWYSHIASVNIELENEFKSMASDRLEPDKYGMKVRSHSGLLEVTSLNKRRVVLNERSHFLVN